MPLHALTITHEDRTWQGAFLDFIPQVFPRVDFHEWHTLGGWNDSYVAYAWADGERIVANVSVSRMELSLQGQSVRGWQLGAVGTLPEYRGRGLQRSLLTRVLGVLDAVAAPESAHPTHNALTFLFANDRVLEFYPRFGFTRVEESQFVAAHSVLPAGPALRALALTDPADRALVERTARAGEPVSPSFGARDYGGLLLWYWSNFFANGLRYVAEHAAIVAVEQLGNVLHIHDIISPKPFDLASYLPRLIEQPIEQLAFGFTPTRYWPSAQAVSGPTDSPLFVRQGPPLPDRPFRYPQLART
jgi:GNAT superfamily N-acetyltransferase